MRESWLDEAKQARDEAYRLCLENAFSPWSDKVVALILSFDRLYVYVDEREPK